MTKGRGDARQNTDLAAAFEQARHILSASADAKSAPARKRYLKTDLDVLGCPVPAIRRAARGIKRSASAPTRQDLVAALERLWESSVHEERVLAVLTAQQFVKSFRASDVRGLFRRWLEDCRTWDLVDGLCTFVIGPIALNHAGVWREIGHWAEANSFWVRRASLLPHIAAIRVGRADLNLLQATCSHLIGENEFFIRKAIGWVLRELAIRNPKKAEPLILELGAATSGLTLREATRRLPEASRQRIYRQLKRRMPKSKRQP